jgi:hypothetical protein
MKQLIYLNSQLYDFLGEGGISEAKLWCKIPEKMKIGGIFSDLLPPPSLNPGTEGAGVKSTL